jgi:hypothetical protein
MTKLNFILIIASLFSLNTISAQVQYNFSHFNQEYKELENATQLSPQQSWDDFIEDFEIEFGCYLYNDSSQYLSVNTSFSSFQNIDQVFFSLHPALLLEEGYSDMNSGPGVAGSRVAYQIDGNIGNRQVKVEFKNLRPYYSSNLDSVSFQIWYFEIDHSIEYHYGKFSINSSRDFLPSVMIGWTDFNTDKLFYQMLEGDPDDPTLVNTTVFDENNYSKLTTSPKAGKVYRFEKSSVGVIENTNYTNIEIYPNPTTSHLKIKNIVTKSLSYIITDINGKAVLKGKLNTSNTIQVKNLPKGKYQLLLKKNNTTYSSSFIKN